MDAWANENDYFICLCESRNDDDFINHIFQSYFDGVIIGSSTFKHEYIQKVIDTNIPVVLLEMRKYNDLTGDFALINSGLYEGSRACCKAFLEKKRKSLVYIDSFTENIEKDHTRDDFRYEGFVDELKANGKYNEDNFRLISHCTNEDELDLKIKDLINDGFKIDALFGRTDAVALQGMFKLKNLGYDIPKDCSVIGVNNLTIASYSDPKLSSLDIDREGIGKYATSILSKMFGGKELSYEESHIVLKTNLIDRESL
jgi:LacI family transcriptional regulator